MLYRDVGQTPPRPVTAQWIHAAFTKPEERTPWTNAVLQESDMLVDELIAADLIVAGVPMYNFSVPDRSRAGEPYWPLLSEMNKKLIILSSRGDFGYGPSERIAHMNHVEPSIRTAFGYIGITDVHSIAVEHDEYADNRLSASIAAAEFEVDDIVDRLVASDELRLAG